MFVLSPKSKLSLSADLAIAAVPAAIWAVYLYGARAAVLMLLCGICCTALDFPVQKFIYKHPWKQSVSPFAFLTGILTMFWMPVTVPLWVPMLAAAIAVLVRSLFLYYGHRIFNPAVFSACVMSFAFPQYMERFTRPFAYFHALQWEIDPVLVEAYRVRTPLDILQDGMLYEDGAIAQFYGFASGAMGAVAIACLLLGGVWLYFRGLLSLRSSVGFLCTIFVLGMAFAPKDADMVTYSYLYLLSGGIAYASVFAMNDLSTLPRTDMGKLLFGVLAGVLTFVFRSALGGEGVLPAVLVCNLLTPLLEFVTRPKDYDYVPRKRTEQFSRLSRTEKKSA